MNDETRRKVKAGSIACLLVMLSGFIGLTVADARNNAQIVQGFQFGSAWKDGGLEAKFFDKVSFIDENQRALGLTGQQLDSIDKLTIDLKKKMVHYGAQIVLLNRDVQAGLESEKVNVKDMSWLIDETYKLEKRHSKRLLRAYSHLQDVLNRNQYKRMYVLKRGRK